MIRLFVVVGFVGFFASFAALMFNCVRKEDIDYSPYEEGEWRSVISLSLCVYYLFGFCDFFARELSLIFQSEFKRVIEF